MDRRNRRRRGSDEINLTPLLDVLFTILFVVMLTSMQSEQTIQAESATTKEQVIEYEKQLAEKEKLLSDQTETIAALEAETAEQSETIAALETETEELEEQTLRLRNQLRDKNAVQYTEESYVANAVLVTVVNNIENGEHVLKIFVGPEGTLRDRFVMGRDREQHIRNHFTQAVRRIVAEAGEFPVYIVFHCKQDSIYHNEEFIPIKEQLEQLKTDYRVVFYQIVEE